MKDLFDSIEIEVVDFSVCDVITESNGNGNQESQDDLP